MVPAFGSGMSLSAIQIAPVPSTATDGSRCCFAGTSSATTLAAKESRHDETMPPSATDASDVPASLGAFTVADVEHATTNGSASACASAPLRRLDTTKVYTRRVAPPLEETVLAFPANLRSLRAARSTVLLGSIAVIRATGRFDAYQAALPPEFHAPLFDALAGTWVPLDATVAHYVACDSLGISIDEEVANGRRVFDRVGATLFGTMMRMAKQVGVTPWTFVPHLQRFYERGYDGGGVAVTKIGPKEARCEIAESEICESRYYRNALRGLLASFTEMFCQKAYIVELPRRHGPRSVALRMQWV